MTSGESHDDALDRVEAFLDAHGLARRMRGPLMALLAAEGRVATTDTVPPSGAPTMALLDLDTRAEEDLPDPGSGPVEPASLVLLGVIAEGGMGEILRAHDPELDRVVAMKVLHERYRDHAGMRGRLLDEARLTAQLAHPAIPPVHDVGELHAGRPFFTMKEVVGSTMHRVLRRLHGDDETWTEHAVLDVMQRVADAIAFAHSRGVVHCDLKPANVMVGEYGEVFVLDWGVARVVGQDDDDRPLFVGGTPAYMPPEHADAAREPVAPTVDVYALGIMLFEVLTGRRPGADIVEEDDAERRLQATASAIQGERGRVDPALADLVATALAPSPDARHPDARVLARALASWREGSARREAAREAVRAASTLIPDAAGAQADAAAFRRRADALLAELPTDAEAANKGEAWSLQERAQELDNHAELKLTEAIERLQGALAHAPDLEAAHRMLAMVHQSRHAAAEARRDWAEARRHEVLLRAHDTGVWASYLRGTATLSVRTDHPCRVRIERVVPRHRRLVPEHVRDLDTPLADVELPIGSYVLSLDAGDRPTVSYPVDLTRLAAWEAVDPTGAEHVVHLPPEGAIGAGEAYVPAGWFVVGGDPDAPGSGPRERHWVDAFAMRRHPVTYAELFAFLAHPAGVAYRDQVMRGSGQLWHPSFPAADVSWEAATAFAAFEAERTGQAWRLPTELEWEKAARGVDGRWYPWGDQTDPSFCHARFATRPPSVATTVSAHLLDVSVYGVYGMAGNVRDWCADAWRVEGAATGDPRRIPPPRPGMRVVRGGSWRQPVGVTRCAARTGAAEAIGHADVGLRLARSIDGGAWVG